MKGRCIDSADTTTLEEGAEYYIFPNGSSHVYVSQFNNVNAHMGCYRKEYFNVIEEVVGVPELLDPDIDLSKLYKADLIWRESGYYSTKLKTYYLKPGKTHAHFYHDKQFKHYGGCFPLRWFSNFEKVKLEEAVLKQEEELLPVNEWTQMSLF